MNTFLRLVAVIFIFVCTAVAWFILGGSVHIRTSTMDRVGTGMVTELWGEHQVQDTPSAYYVERTEVPVYDTEKVIDYDEYGNAIYARKIDERTGEPEVDFVEAYDYFDLAGSDIRVNLDLEHRKKGLLWYSTYTVDFEGKYAIENPRDEETEVFVHFDFPAENTIFDDFKFELAGEEQPVPGDLSAGITAGTTLAPGEATEAVITYRSQGLEDWRYVFGSGITDVKNFKLTAFTDFEKIDFPEGTISPAVKEETEDGWKLTWEYKHLISGNDIGVQMPTRMNPGPMAYKITYFAPVTLLFFFTVLFIAATVKADVKIHPMHFFFLACAFFVFHLLMAYTVDHVNIHLAFWISALVSCLLVFIYLLLVVRPRFALAYGTAPQLMFLVLFSYAWFVPGYTGLIITIGSIITLAVLMVATARVDWAARFAGKGNGNQVTE
jgi:hypothetical protein